MNAASIIGLFADLNLSEIADCPFTSLSFFPKMSVMQLSASNQLLDQLRRQELDAWTELVRHNSGLDNLRVDQITTNQIGTNQTRYELEVWGISDPLTLIGRETNSRESHFYNSIAPQLSDIVSRPWLNHWDVRESWLILPDAPHDRLPSEWQAGDVNEMLTDMAMLHASHWGDKQRLFSYRWLPLLLGLNRKNQRSLHKRLSAEERGIVSEHALQSVQGLTNEWLLAAKGLRLLFDVEGWPGVIDERHLRIMADLLDDPLPMLFPLRELPLTLLHGYPGIYNWRVSVIGARTLVDWQASAIGPGVWDLVTFLETFGLLHDKRMAWKVRENWPLAEETMIDSYLLALSAELGSAAQTRTLRHAIPAARCLYILLTWLPRFHKWFHRLPADLTSRRQIWHAINEYSETELAGTIYAPIAGLRPYLTETFNRFLKAYYQIS